MTAELPPIRAVLACRVLSSANTSIEGYCAGDCAPVSEAYRDPLGVDCYSTQTCIQVTCAEYSGPLAYNITYCCTALGKTKQIWPVGRASSHHCD